MFDANVRTHDYPLRCACVIPMHGDSVRGLERVDGRSVSSKKYPCLHCLVFRCVCRSVVSRENQTTPESEESDRQNRVTINGGAITKFLRGCHGTEVFTHQLDIQAVLVEMALKRHFGAFGSPLAL